MHQVQKSHKQNSSWWWFQVACIKRDSHLEKSNQKNKEQDKSWSFCRVCFKFQTSYNDDSFCLQTTQKHTHTICNFIDWRKEWEKRCTDSVLFSALRCCWPKLQFMFVHHGNLLHRWKNSISSQPSVNICHIFCGAWGQYTQNVLTF